MRKALSVIISLIVVAILVVIDQISKLWIVKNMVPYKDEKKVIDGVFSLRYIKNSGAAWGSFSGKTILLLVISIILIPYFFTFLSDEPKTLHINNKHHVYAL